MGAIEKLIDILIEAFEYVKPWAVVLEWQTGVMLRCGRYRRILRPGYYWKMPFFEYAEIHDTAITTFRLHAQSYMGRTVRGTLKYRIHNIKPFVCDIFSEENLLRDTSMAHIKRGMVEGISEEEILDRIRKEVTPYGFKIFRLTLIEDVEARSYRVLLDQKEDID